MFPTRQGRHTRIFGLMQISHHGADLMVRSTNEAVLGFYDHLGYEDADVSVRSKWLG